MVPNARETAPVTKPFSWFTLGLILLAGAVLANLAFLNYLVLWSRYNTKATADSVESPTATDVTLQKSAAPESKNTGVAIDYTEINKLVQTATSSLTQRVEELSTAAEKTTVSTGISAVKVKEYYIPLGTGETSSSDWVDLPGVEAYLAPSNYGQITGLYFEAGIRIPTGSGRVYARLRNVTDNIGLVESEVSQEGTNTGLASSGKIPIPVGTKLYRVQLKSTLGTRVVLDSARIKLFVN